MSDDRAPGRPACGGRLRLPDWLRVKTGKAHLGRQTRDIISAHGLHTVCESAHCPNIGECYCSGTATFMVMGDVCTRDCSFCAVTHGIPGALDPEEPQRVARAAQQMDLRYVVVTCVTRDDLPDGGAAHFAATVRALKLRMPGVKVEVLPSDMKGDRESIKTILAAGPDVFNHTLETVRRLQTKVRPQAGYGTSLRVLRAATDLGALTKSGLIVGMGETRDELKQTLDDLVRAGVAILTIGQYLQPSRRHHAVARYVPPEEFDEFRLWGLEAGLRHVLAGPFVRSSYKAAEAMAAATAENVAIPEGSDC